MNRFGTSLFILFIALLLSLAYKWVNLTVVPPINPPHPYFVLNEFLSESQHKTLMEMIQNYEIPSGKQVQKSTRWMNIGEDYEPSADGKCNKHLTIFDNRTNKCQFIPQSYVGPHLIKTGGYNGWKESRNKLKNRATTFLKHIDNLPEMQKIVGVFDGNIAFQKQMGEMCGESHPYFKPYLLNIGLQMNGQLVPHHSDEAYFLNGLTVYSFPGWLITVIKHSGLFDDIHIPKLSAIIYIHDWQYDNHKTFGGEFVAWPKGINHKPDIIHAAPRSAIVVDGEIVHCTATFKPYIKPPNIGNVESFFKFDSLENVWRLYIDDKATNITHSWQDIRATIVYRGLCFNDKTLMNKWDPKQRTDGDITLTNVLEILKNDLIEHKKIISLGKWNSMDNYQKGLFLMDTYLKLPNPTLSILPFNYCAVFEILPNWSIIKIIQDFIC